jgi:hypothetical protein
MDSSSPLAGHFQPICNAKYTATVADCVSSASREPSAIDSGTEFIHFFHPKEICIFHLKDECTPLFVIVSQSAFGVLL